MSAKDIGIDTSALEKLFQIDTSSLDTFVDKNRELWGAVRVSEYLGVTERTVRRYVEKGWLKPYTKKGRSVLYSHYDVVELYWKLHNTETTMQNITDPITKERKYRELVDLIISDPIGITALNEAVSEME